MEDGKKALDTMLGKKGRTPDTRHSGPEHAPDERL